MSKLCIFLFFAIAFIASTTADGESCADGKQCPPGEHCVVKINWGGDISFCTSNSAALPPNGDSQVLRANRLASNH
ncbi:unnamed protein product, partial [Mesorhabditis belari]|uniref:Uncharacterized protein n=1 Tax=Mesorhabditis belari TaxID=2138241 RepID=A0AAF3FB57_9BILA